MGNDFTLCVSLINLESWMNKRSFGRTLLFSVLGISIASHAWAKKNEAVHESFRLEAPTHDGIEYSTEEFKEMLSKAKENSKRRVANVDSIDEATALSEQFRNIRNSVIGGSVVRGGQRTTVRGAESAEDVQKLLTDLEGNFKNLTDPDAKLLAAQLLMMKPYRGIIARANQIFETGSGKARLAHATAVTMLRAAAVGVEVYLPTEQWRAAFDYSVHPFYAKENANCQSKWSSQCDIKDGQTFQAWIRKEVIPSLDLLEKTLRGMKFDRPVYFDNQIFFGKANFTSNKDRFLRLGEAERLVMLSSVQAALSSALAMQAYSLDGFFKSFDQVATVYGFEATFSASKATSEGRFGAIRKFPKLFALKKDEENAKKYLEVSYKYLKSSLNNAFFAWKSLDGRENDTNLQQNLIDPRLVAPFSRVIGTGFQNAFGIVGMTEDGRETGAGDVMSAVVNGEKVTVNLKKFFDDPPNSLQDFMPTAFKGGEEFLTKNVDGKAVKYRNYFKGRPAEWNYAVYGKYFSGVNNAADVERTARVLSQSWGGFILGGPMAAVMF